MKHRTGLPHSLRPLFWDYLFSNLTWERDRDLIIGRILAVGDWESVLWLRAHLHQERPPVMIWSLDWKTVKKTIKAWVCEWYEKSCKTGHG